MHQGKPLIIAPFSSAENPLNNCNSPQALYLKAYLGGAGVVSILLEENYFDRDYLDEFSSFYSKSAKGYPNICKRIHFFCADVSLERIESALKNDAQSAEVLQESYLGFIVWRPLHTAPFGRTVLSWYKNSDPHSDRVTPELRKYVCNVLGLRLSVYGIPWQQQDRGVSACATIALWSMFHSSAFDANHSIPTTVEITQNALGATSGSRAFPSKGLSIPELNEAIFAQNLSPKVLSANKYKPSIPYQPATDGCPEIPYQEAISGFAVEYMASMCAANIRSGYPVLLVGDYVHAGPSGQRHAICCIGFREKEQAVKPSGSCSTMDDETEIFYVHDDNIGPNVRCRLVDEDGFAVLVTDAPAYVSLELIQPNPTVKFRPAMMIIAVHAEIRMDAESLVNQGAGVASFLSTTLNDAYAKAGLPLPAVSYNSQFLDVRDFFSGYLDQVLGANPNLLGRVRLALGRDAPPMCLHVGLLSMAIVNGGINRLMDVIYDTTDASMMCPAIAHVVYDQQLKSLLDQFPPADIRLHFGAQILAF